VARKKNQPDDANKKRLPVNWEVILAGISGGRTFIEYGANQMIFWQGEPANAVFFIRKGRVKLVVTSKQGKEVIVALLDAGGFFGEGCLAGQSLRMATATAITDCSLSKIEKPTMARMLHEHRDAAELFVTHLLSRNIHYEADLVDQLFNSSEKRLARILLTLAHVGKESRSETIVPHINQESLAQMVGTNREWISHFMNKFRKLGFVDYTRSGGLTVNSGLLSVVLHETED
jgi:CRP/FNR family cyclic AMP-dependent transcriptional regulator